MAMFENWKKNLDKGGKPFDCLRHQISLATLNAYGFNYKSLKLISNFLRNRKYRTKVNLCFSKWEHLLIGVPQRPVLGPLLLNIYMYDLFLLIESLNLNL